MSDEEKKPQPAPDDYSLGFDPDENLRILRAIRNRRELTPEEDMKYQWTMRDVARKRRDELQSHVRSDPPLQLRWTDDRRRPWNPEFKSSNRHGPPESIRSNTEYMDRMNSEDKEFLVAMSIQRERDLQRQAAQQGREERRQRFAERWGQGPGGERINQPLLHMIQSAPPAEQPELRRRIQQALVNDSLHTEMTLIKEQLEQSKKKKGSGYRERFRSRGGMF